MISVLNGGCRNVSVTFVAEGQVWRGPEKEQTSQAGLTRRVRGCLSVCLRTRVVFASPCVVSM